MSLGLASGNHQPSKTGVHKLTGFLRLCAAALGSLTLGLTGCALMKPPDPLVYVPPLVFQEIQVSTPEKPTQQTSPRRIAIFFDGTANDTRSGTNTAALHTLVRESAEVATFYIEGVGAKGKPLGMAIAWGTGMRVRAAYAFLLDTYRAGDEIYLFGFSRGAYSARILASLLYHAGLPQDPAASRPLLSASETAEVVYDAFKCSTWSSDATCEAIKSEQRIENIKIALEAKNLKAMAAVPVRFLGLWDTVEALGWPDYKENVDVPNPRYGDQLCNVQKAAHALALDDNRARIFTPILLNRRHLLSDCGRSEKRDDYEGVWRRLIDEKVEEVYFAGAHADVGGGYDDAPNQLSGVSLNWMIDRAGKEGLPIGNRSASAPLVVSQEALACTHDAEGAFPFNLVYKRMYRSIDAYADSPSSSSQRVKFHACLVEHIKLRPRGPAEYGGADELAQEVLKAAGSGGLLNRCFGRKDGEVVFRSGGNCRIDVVDTCPRPLGPISSCTAAK